MRIRQAGIGIAGALGMTLPLAAQATEFWDDARGACARQIDSAYDALSGVCTAAAVVDLAISADGAACDIARVLVVEYLKSCVEHAAALMREGKPVELPPFPDLGAQANQVLAEVGAPETPMPVGWPFLLAVAFEDLPSLAAAFLHEANRDVIQSQLAVLLGTVRVQADDAAVEVAEDASVAPTDGSAASSPAAPAPAN